MSELLGPIQAFFEQVSGLVWGWPAWPAPLLVVALVGTGVFLTLRLRLVNLRGLGSGFRILRGDYDNPSDSGDVSHFQALTTALSATVGVGNIAGVATAIHYGGPGALFWMWVTAFVGMSSKYCECTLAVRYRRLNPDGTVSGGPMYYIEHGLGRRWKPLALVFALFAALSAFGSGNAVQAHTMAEALRSAYGTPTWIAGLASAVVVGLVIVGGIQRIGHVTARVVPLMAAVYVGGALVILVLRFDALPQALGSVFAGVLRPTAALGGFAGATFVSTMMWGVKRGLFSNEAGQGSAPIAHAAARTEEPVREGLVALLEPSIDTLAICTLTGLVILCTGSWHDRREVEVPLHAQSGISVVSSSCAIEHDGVLGPQCELGPSRHAVRDGRLASVRLVRHQSLVRHARLVQAGQPFSGTLQLGQHGRVVALDREGRPASGVLVRGAFVENGEPLTAWAFQQGLQPLVPFGGQLVTICVVLFALSTAIGWSYYGERSIHYVFGQRAIGPYRGLYLLLNFVGAISTHEGAWAFSDVALGLMTFPNLLALLLLSGKIARMTDDYWDRSAVRSL